MIRLDQLLVDRGLIRSRAKAGEHIRQHGAIVDGKEVRKPGKKFPSDIPIELIGEVMPWVGRGALKLLRAIDLWKIDFEECTGLDVGASTGGFTEVMLSHGARKVFAVDTGHDQLHPSLQENARVVCLDRTDIRNIKPEDIEPCNRFTVDVSFISLRLVLPFVLKLCIEGSEGVVLVKPQFEVGKDRVGKGGIVKDQKVRIDVINDMQSYARSLGFHVKGDTPSPITGGDGNVEHLLWLSLPPPA